MVDYDSGRIFYISLREARVRLTNLDFNPKYLKNPHTLGERPRKVKKEMGEIYLILSTISILIISQIPFLPTRCAAYETENQKMPAFVAHAGGGVYGLTYTNSLEALNYNYNKGFRFFEVDLEWTQDKELVLMHDWNSDRLKRLFSAKPKVYSLSEFKGLKMAHKLTQMSLDDLIKWLRQHPDVYIITDIKSNNIKGLNKIGRSYPVFLDRFIPQIYNFREYEEVKSLGFKNVILTLYASNYNDAEVIQFLAQHRVCALTMWYDRASNNFISELKKLKIFIYVHIVSDTALQIQLKALGVDGFYTDFLKPLTLK